MPRSLLSSLFRFSCYTLAAPDARRSCILYEKYVIHTAVPHATISEQHIMILPTTWKSVLTADLWFSIHLPIVSALTIVGDASAELIKDNLDVPSGVRWIFCGGYSVAMIGIWALAMLDTDEDAPGEIWFPMVRPSSLPLPLVSSWTATDDWLTAAVENKAGRTSH